MTYSRSVPNPAVAACESQDQMIMSMLISSVHEEVIPLIVEQTSWSGIWYTLELAFASPSTFRVLQLHLELQIPQKANKNITTHLNRMKAISNERAAIGRHLLPADFTIYIFYNVRP